MRTLAESNPVAVFFYYLCVLLPVLFTNDPILAALSLCGALPFFCLGTRKNRTRTHLFCLALFTLAVCINPLLNHNGQTVLFVINDSPMTLESLCYGACSALALSGVLYWFFSFSATLQSDKLLYLFGKFSPKLSLLLSMTLRYLPLFAAQRRKVRAAQKALGLYREANVFDDIRAEMRVTSVMVSWALENGIVTADSMRARGYGTHRRSFYAPFRFRKGDACLLCLSLALCALCIWGLAARTAGFVFYPRFVPPENTLSSFVAYGAYAALSLLPLLLQAKEAFRWKLLRSTI